MDGAGRAPEPARSGRRVQLAGLLPKEAQPLWKAVEDRLFPPGEEDGAVLDRPDELVFRFTEAFYGDFAAENFDNAKTRLEGVDELMNFRRSTKSTADF